MKKILSTLIFILLLLTQCESHKGFKEITTKNLEGKWELLGFRAKSKDWIDKGDTEYLEIFDDIWKETYIDDYSDDEFYEPPTYDTTSVSLKYRLKGDNLLEVYFEHYSGEKEFLHEYRIEHICENELIIKTTRSEFLSDFLPEYKYSRVY